MTRKKQKCSWLQERKRQQRKRILNLIVANVVLACPALLDVALPQPPHGLPPPPPTSATSSVLASASQLRSLAIHRQPHSFWSKLSVVAEFNRSPHDFWSAAWKLRRTISPTKLRQKLIDTQGFKKDGVHVGFVSTFFRVLQWIHHDIRIAQLLARFLRLGGNNSKSQRGQTFGGGIAYPVEELVLWLRNDYHTLIHYAEESAKIIELQASVPGFTLSARAPKVSLRWLGEKVEWAKKAISQVIHDFGHDCLLSPRKRDRNLQLETWMADLEVCPLTVPGLALPTESMIEISIQCVLNTIGPLRSTPLDQIAHQAITPFDRALVNTAHRYGTPATIFIAPTPYGFMIGGTARKGNFMPMGHISSQLHAVFKYLSAQRKEMLSILAPTASEKFTGIRSPPTPLSAQIVNTEIGQHATAGTCLHPGQPGIAVSLLSQPGQIVGPCAKCQVVHQFQQVQQVMALPQNTKWYDYPACAEDAWNSKWLRFWHDFPAEMQRRLR